MPLTTPLLTGTIITGLLSGGLIGPAMPKLASGIAIGISTWVPQLTVNTVDTGSLGVGAGFLPFLIPPPLLIGSLLVAYAANGHLGPMSPLEATGIGNGISLGLLQGIIQTQHPTVGTGTAVGRVSGPPAFSSLMQGFSSVGITGQGASQKANAISIALMVTLQSLVFPIPIVGSGSPSPSGGVGIGKIL